MGQNLARAFAAFLDAEIGDVLAGEEQTVV